ncbi:UxaA family hydrolase [Sulfobacillus harzensis]|uniref:UxaA family hydrolase n=1 Tax=Sulfobacillus harzensis TaxID=2729629 RepID=A0A7Y0L1N8_9FIRM|nr:UxaA family hydrolase [Sulfobacillus harzensis]NMP21382.1 UxaA family hydrolase [Sulfobacillus harzensis]
MRTEFMGYRRSGGHVGVRDYLLALPSVVCATRAAFWAVEGTDAIAIEHPIGCAQIGADREQTRRVLVGIGAHPNVRAAMVIGLGCEGVPAQEVYQGLLDRGQATAVATIQESGGTREAAQAARTFLAGVKAVPREQVGIQDLVLGVGPIEALGAAGRALVEAFLDRGGRIVFSATDDPGALPYGTPIPPSVRCAAMEAGTGPTETMTGLAACGAQILLGICDPHNLGGHPIVPVIRLGADERFRRALSDDMDGMIGDRDPDGWVDWILAVASGEMTLSESLGTASFAIERIGPTL